MKLNGKIISSLESLKLNFNYLEIRHKLNVAIRDLSPQFLYYKYEKDKRFFYAFEFPDKVEWKGDELIFEDSYSILLKLSEEEKFIINELPEKERVRTIAIYKLAKKEIDNEVLKISSPVSEDIGEEILLNGGVILNCTPEYIQYGHSLEHKLIRIKEDSKSPCLVGGYEMKAGQSTYGVFYKDKLVAVCAPASYNEAYYLEYGAEDGKTILKVYDKDSDILIAKYKNAHYYCLIEEKNFAVIDGLLLYSFTNQGLNHRLRKCILNTRNPEIIYQDGDKLKIIYDDSTIEEIEI